MASGNDQNWGKKGACLGKFFLYFFLFILLLIWLYNHKAGDYLG